MIGDSVAPTKKATQKIAVEFLTFSSSGLDCATGKVFMRLLRPFCYARYKLLEIICCPSN